MMCSDTINQYETDEFYRAGNAQSPHTQRPVLPDLLHPDTTAGTPLIWHRPTNCPALQRFPHYSVAHPTPTTYHLKGIHFRYEPYKDRAKLWLPLHSETIPGTPLHRYQPIALTIHDSTTNQILNVAPHNLCQSRHPQRGYIRLGYNATQYFKDIHNIHETRLVNNPHVTVTLTPSTYQHPTGPPNKWKPEFLNQAYKLGLLEETAYALGYETITSADIHFQSGGYKSRPDVIAKMRKTGSSNLSLVIIEGKACQERKAPYFILEATIQLLHSKIIQDSFKNAKDAVIAITGEVNKIPWKEFIESIQISKNLPCSQRTRKWASEIWKKIVFDPNYWQTWYDNHLNLHNISDLKGLAKKRSEKEKKEILRRLELIRWG